MPRDLPLGNGRLLVNFDSHYNLRDIYFPHVGQANHAYGCRSRLGVWTGGVLLWHETPGWELDLRYEQDTMVTDVTAAHPQVGLKIKLRDAVDFNMDVLLRRVDVTNTSDEPRDVRLFFHVDFALWGSDVGDTAFYHPDTKSVVAYKNDFYLLANGSFNGKAGLHDWTTGHKHGDQETGTWVDAEDGELDNNPVAFGSVDCVGGLRMGELAPGASATAHWWMAVGRSLDEVVGLDRRVVGRGVESLIDRTGRYWRAWASKESGTKPELERVPDDLKELYTRSLLLIRAHTDHDGGIIAAGDSNISFPYHSHGEVRRPVADPFQGHEHYAYVWPRDGALIAHALDRAGYGEISRQFVRFCARAMVYDQERDWGYMLQRYHPNGTVASNVIPWIDEHGNQRLPIQEDETGLMLFLLWEHYDRYRDWELITPAYRNFIKPIGNFLLDYRDPATGLPLPSQDAWEERDGVHAYTVATVWAGLQAAARFTAMFGEQELAERYLKGAREIKEAVERHLYDDEEERFVRTVELRSDGGIRRDPTVDSSVYGLFYFGMFDANDPRIERTMDAVIDRLTVHAKSGGLARYEGDQYQKAEIDQRPGNAWFICTLWLAEYYIRKARRLGDLKPAREILEWVRERALPSGVLAEQLHPTHSQPVSTSPLTWSSATFLLTLQEYAERYAKFASE